MPSADFCPAIGPPHGAPSRRSDTEQISWGKLSRLPRTVAESTLRALDGYGLRGTLPDRPALAPRIRFLSIDSRICLVLTAIGPMTVFASVPGLAPKEKIRTQWTPIVGNASNHYRAGLGTLFRTNGKKASVI